MPPPDFSIFDDLKSKSQELEKLIGRAKDGQVVSFPDVYYNPHDVSPEFPDKPVWIRAILFPLNTSNGVTELFVFMHENITERKIAENALIESEMQFKSLFENAADAIFIADKNTGIILNANKAASILLEKPISDIVGIHQTQLHPPEIENKSKQNFENQGERLMKSNSVNVIENETTTKNYRLKADIKTDSIEYEDSTESYIGLQKIYWPNAGYLEFYDDPSEKAKLEINKKVRCVDDKGKEWYIELTNQKVK